ncbi:cyclic nucleotide-binding domain-containing protein 1 [Artibeus jamaicensis]|uniref:cyclic nucleotide-binding domain-containing protein 1 n=1 Tax=Artibeus jamaicensis TaxID=9417 RepID=UPI00235A592E|nr:cyclic nucleotide-binding domain-containing protein 1 [Artibeus jamaicensis]
MPVSSLSSAILSHMRAINSVPPPLPSSLPRLKVSKHIDYGQLNALCHMSGQQSRSALNILSAHDKFIRQYPKIFLQEKNRLPKLSKQEGTRKPSEETEETQPRQSDNDSHNIAIYVKKARGGHTLYGSKNIEEKLEEFLAILKKLPIHRTQREHNTVWKMLKTIPDLASQLTDDNLKTLSKNVISETWVKGSTVVGNDGFYVILKGLARPRTQVYENLFEENGSASFIPQRFHSLVSSDDLENTVLAEMHMPVCDLMLRPWSTFGTLEVTAQVHSELKEYSVVAEEDCEILKIPAKNYAKLKLEKTNLENKQIVKLIRKCPYYEEWPTLSIYELVLLVKWKRFPPGHVIVESGNIISFVAYISSGHCNIYKNIIGLLKLQSKKVKKIKKLVYMGQLKKQESFGEISVLLQDPFPCTVITGDKVEMAVIEDKDLLGRYKSVFLF